VSYVTVSLGFNPCVLNLGRVSFAHFARFCLTCWWRSFLGHPRLPVPLNPCESLPFPCPTPNPLNPWPPLWGWLLLIGCHNLTFCRLSGKQNQFQGAGPWATSSFPQKEHLPPNATPPPWPPSISWPRLLLSACVTMELSGSFAWEIENFHLLFV